MWVSSPSSVLIALSLLFLVFWSSLLLGCYYHDAHTPLSSSLSSFFFLLCLLLSRSLPCLSVTEVSHSSSSSCSYYCLSGPSSCYYGGFLLLALLLLHPHQHLVVNKKSPRQQVSSLGSKERFLLGPCLLYRLASLSRPPRTTRTRRSIIVVHLWRSSVVLSPSSLTTTGVGCSEPSHHLLFLLDYVHAQLRSANHKITGIGLSLLVPYSFLCCPAFVFLLLLSPRSLRHYLEPSCSFSCQLCPLKSLLLPPIPFFVAVLIGGWNLPPKGGSLPE